VTFHNLVSLQKEAVLGNETSPGPGLRLSEGKMYWIRVYNDIFSSYFLMVSSYFFSLMKKLGGSGRRGKGEMKWRANVECK